MQFNSLMTEFFEGSYTPELVQCIFADIKTKYKHRKCLGVV